MKPDWSLLPPSITYVFWDGKHWRATTMRPEWNPERDVYVADPLAETLSRPLPPVVVGALPRPLNARLSLYVR